MSLVKNGALACLVLLCTAAAANEESKTLQILASNNTIPKSLLEQFSQETGIEVLLHQYSHNNGEYLDLSSDDFNFDVALLPGTQRTTKQLNGNELKNYGQFQELDFSLLPNASRLSKPFSDIVVSQQNKSNIPFLIETYSYAINSDMLNQDLIPDWSSLWDSQWFGQILLVDDAHLALGMALIQLGYSVNSVNISEINQAFDLLVDLKPNILEFDSHGQATAFLSGDVSLGMLSNRSAYIAQQEGASVDLVWSEKTPSIINLYSLTIPKNNQTNVQEAHQLINFLLRPRSAAIIAYYATLPTTIGDAKQHLPPSFHEDLNLNPPQHVLDNGAYLQDLGSTLTLYNGFFFKLKK